MCGSYRDPLYCTVDDVISNWSHFTAVMHEPNDTIKLTKTISFKLKEKIKFRQILFNINIVIMTNLMTPYVHEDNMIVEQCEFDLIFVNIKII